MQNRVLRVCAFVGVLAGAGCVTAQAYERAPEFAGAKSGKLPWGYKEILIQAINSDFEALPDNPQSLDRLLEILVAYRYFRELYGDDTQVVDHVRYLENRLFFWNQENSVGVLAMHPGHPILVLPTGVGGSRIAYSRSETYFAMMPFAGIEGFKLRRNDEPVVIGTGVPNVVGPRLSRDIPAVLTMASRAEIGDLHELARARDEALRDQASWEVLMQAAVGYGALRLMSWLVTAAPSAGGDSPAGRASRPADGDCRVEVEVPGFNKTGGYLQGEKVVAEVPGFNRVVGYVRGDSVVAEIPGFNEIVGYIKGERVIAKIPGFDKTTGYLEGDRVVAEIPGFNRVIGYVHGSCGARGAAALFLILGYLKTTK